MSKLKYLFLGFIFGVILIKAEVVSWFRIQEMFRFQAFHMYGIIGSAIVVGAISILLIKKFKVKTIYGKEIIIVPKEFTKGNIIGGLIFGLGWAMTGACPGPLYALIGSGLLVITFVLFFAVLGTWAYGRLKDKLPH
ncbi:MAG: YeeE/YedE thiosulfate transporter family protein [Bacteroidetes bacterium]|nr:YeeE/YedE thiosulfate transporter family protein [Bacteroidota bacterium]